MAYSDKVIEHYNNPRNVGALPKDDDNVGTGLVGAPDAESYEAADQGHAEPGIEDAGSRLSMRSAIASSSLATEWVKEQTVEALSIKNTDIVKNCLPPVKIHCRFWPRCDQGGNLNWKRNTVGLDQRLMAIEISDNALTEVRRRWRRKSRRRRYTLA
jgi:nitrogen fixation NifU-like protein